MIGHCAFCCEEKEVETGRPRLCADCLKKTKGAISAYSIGSFCKHETEEITITFKRCKKCSRSDLSFIPAGL